jgi:hypothetical protein
MIAKREEQNDDEFVAWVQKALKHGLARFEEWLSLQAWRDDESGKVARHVIADLERGCWPRRKKVRSHIYYGAKRELEEDLWHLRSEHNLSSGSLQTFERVFERFRQENNEYEREKLRMRVRELMYDALGVHTPQWMHEKSIEYEALSRTLRGMIRGCQSKSGVKLYEIACYVASEHLELPPREYGRMLTPLVGEEIHLAEDWVQSGFVAFV